MTFTRCFALNPSFSFESTFSFGAIWDLFPVISPQKVYVFIHVQHFLSTNVNVGHLLLKVAFFENGDPPEASTTH